MKKIGFIGLGHMGAPMVRNLLQHHFEVQVFDVNPESIQSLTKQGARPATSLTEIAHHSDIIITMLPTGNDVKKVYSGESGLLRSAKPGLLLIDSSTIAVEEARGLHEMAKQVSIKMIDAPVSGGVAAAEKAMLTFMVGGEQEDFERAKPVLESMGKAVIYAGSSGSGQAAKICNNMLLGISMVAVAEAFTLAKKLGLDAQKLFEISSKASGQCWSMTSYCPVPHILPDVPSSHNYQPGFTVAMMLKDLRLSQAAAQHVDAATPLGAEAAALYTLFSNQGASQLDFSAIIKLIEGKTRTE